MRAKVVPIFHYKIWLKGFTKLCNGWQHAVGENIFIRPGFACRQGLVAADGVN